MSTDESNGKEPEQESTKKRPFAVIAFAVGLSILIVMAVLFGMFISFKSMDIGEKESPRLAPRAGFKWEIQEGDRDYYSYRYDDALTHYQQARSKLDYEMRFETESPMFDKATLQHYYNVGQLLKARTELVLIAREVSRLPEQSDR